MKLAYCELPNGYSGVSGSLFTKSEIFSSRAEVSSRIKHQQEVTQTITFEIADYKVS